MEPTAEMLVGRIESLEAELAEAQAEVDALELRLYDTETRLQVALGQLCQAKQEPHHADVIVA